MPDFVLPKETIVPNHIAMILDGNRRWARARGLKPWEGHKAGYVALRKVAQSARELGVHTFTIWAFSTENWDRPKEEIEEIFSLLKKGLQEFSKEAHKDKVRLIHLGRKDRFPQDLVSTLVKLEKETRNYANNILNLALDYGGRDEIVRVIQRIIKDKVPYNKIDEKLVESYLDTSDQPYPYPDLFIRTSGEQRTSGLMPWQLTYSELYFEQCHLPDFTPEKLMEAIVDYSRRRRRFGGNDLQKHLTFKPEISARLELAWWRLRRVPSGTRFRDFVISYLREQYGLSKNLAKEAAVHFLEAVSQGNKKEWQKAKKPLKKFYKLIKDHLKLAFEPEIVTSLKVNFWQEVGNGFGEEIENIATNLTAEEYRISNFQAAKAAHLRVLAEKELRLAEEAVDPERSRRREIHWQKASDYLTKYYKALKERVA